MISYLSCRHTTRLQSDRLERSLSCFEWFCLGVHFLGCASCCRFGRVIRWLHRALPRAPLEVRLPAEARERIQCALDAAVREEQGS
jgi:hypothetical protein